MSKSKRKNKHFKKAKVYQFGMAAVQGLKLPKIDKSPDSNWKELEKELKISQKSKNLKKKPRHRLVRKSEKPTNDFKPSQETNLNTEVKSDPKISENPSIPSEVTECIALDCEMVGVGVDGKEHMLARCSIVNSKCEKIYDKFVRPCEEVVDYRYPLTGIKPSHLAGGDTFKVVQKEVSDIIKNRVLVGHTLRSDLKVLFLDHPKLARRDVSTYKPLTGRTRYGRPGLKLMSEVILDKSIQEGHHDSVEDAIAAMQLYLVEKRGWERNLQRRKKNNG